MQVSALLPVYNGEGHLATAIESILGQTRVPDEIVVLDDGSTDASSAVAGRYPEVRVMRQANAGIGAARQRLIEEAKHDWVAFCDHDDHWLPAKLERQMSLVAERVVLIHTGHSFYWPDGRSVRRDWVPPEGSTALDHLLPDCQVNTSSVLIDRRALAAAGGFPVDLRRAEDYAAWFRLARMGEFRRVPDECVRSLEREGSASAPDLGWFQAERLVLERECLPWVTGRHRALAARKLAILASLEAACLDRDGDRSAARRRHLEAVRGNPTSPGAWLRLARHLVHRP